MKLMPPERKHLTKQVRKAIKVSPEFAKGIPNKENTYSGTRA